MPETTDTPWIHYENTAQDKQGFLLISIFQNEAQQNQAAIDTLKKERATKTCDTLRPAAFLASDFASVSKQDIADKFNLKDADDWDGNLAQWLDNKNHNEAYRQEAIQGLIKLTQDKLHTANNRLRVRLIYNDGPDDTDPWYTYYIFNEKDGFYTMGLADDPIDNVLHKSGDNTFQITAGENTITVTLQGESILYEELIKGHARTATFKRTIFPKPKI